MDNRPVLLFKNHSPGLSSSSSMPSTSVRQNETNVLATYTLLATRVKSLTHRPAAFISARLLETAFREIHNLSLY